MIRLSPLGTLALGGGVLAAVGGFLFWFADHHYDRGYAARDEDAREAAEIVQQRLRVVSLEADRAARELLEAQTLNENLLEELAREADQDPDGVSLAERPDSVRRLNAAGGYTDD